MFSLCFFLLKKGNFLDSMDESWIHEPNRISARYLQRVADFIDFAFKSSANGKLACLCVKYVNGRRYALDVVIDHLLNHGFSPSYTHWFCHGESLSEVIGSNKSNRASYDHGQCSIDAQLHVRQFIEDIVIGYTHGD